VISPTPSHPQNSGSRARVYSLLTSIKKMGHDLYFLHISAEADGNRELMQACWGDKFYSVPYSQSYDRPSLIMSLQRIIKGIPHLIDDWYDSSLNKVLVSLSKKFQFDVVVVEYVFFSKALECFGQEILKIVDTIDVFSNRHERMIKQGLQPNWYSASHQEEARGLNRADVVIAISGEDQRFLSELVSNKVVTIGHIVPLHEPIPRQSSSTCKMLFVGSANPMNVQAVRFFIDKVFPRVRLQYPSAQALVAGTVCELLEDRDDYVIMGKPADLGPIYAAADMVINPMLFGTGLSIKGLEALGYAKPLVTTSVGARGLGEEAGKSFLVANTPEEFSAAIVSVLSDTGLYETLSKNAYALVSRWNKRNLEALENLFNI
jgi:polysaccharide biosynthesis protein PslH